MENGRLWSIVKGEKRASSYCLSNPKDRSTGKEKATLAVTEIQSYLNLLPKVKQSPEGSVWLTYDKEADTLYINYKKPSHATDSELTDDDVIVRYEGDEIVGLTILHASTR